MGQVANVWDPLISAIFTQEYFDNQCELSVGYNLLVRKMKERLSNNFLSNTKESSTFSINKGSNFGGSCSQWNKIKNHLTELSKSKFCHSEQTVVLPAEKTILPRLK